MYNILFKPRLCFNGLVILISLIILLIHSCTTISIPQVSKIETRLGYIDSRFKNASIESHKIILPLLKNYPGISVAVFTKKGLVWSEAFGFSDIEKNIKVNSKTLFRVYSTTKPITATAVMYLVQQGKIDLDDPITMYLPDLPRDFQDITIKQLAGHLSGIRSYRDGEWLQISSDNCSEPFEALKQFVSDPLLFKPGSDFSYSSFNYVLLSALIEKVSGQSFAGFVKSVIFIPSGMLNSYYTGDDSKETNMSTFYEEGWFGRVKVAQKVDNSCQFGAGALVSTAQDLARFGHSLLAGQILNTENINQSLRSLTKTNGQQTGYAFGWYVGEESGLQYAAHSGGAIGGRSALVLLPESQIVVAITANIEHKQLVNEAFEIGRFFLADLKK